jgi:hypothetical protein
MISDQVCIVHLRCAALTTVVSPRSADCRVVGHFFPNYDKSGLVLALAIELGLIREAANRLCFEGHRRWHSTQRADDGTGPLANPVADKLICPRYALGV